MSSAISSSDHLDESFPNNGLPASLTNQLATVGQTIETANVWRKLSVGFLFVVFSTVLLVAVSILFEVQAPVTRAFFLATGLASYSFMFWYLFRRPSRKNSQLSNAWAIEKSCVGLEERLSSSVQFCNGEAASKEVSREMVGMVAMEAERKLAKLDAVEVPHKSYPITFLLFSSSLTIALFLAGFYLTIFLIVARNTVLPFAKFQKLPLSIEVQPGSLVTSANRPVLIQVKDSWLTSPSVQLRQNPSDAFMTMDPTVDQHFSKQINPQIDSVRYRITEGIWATKWYEVTVEKKPKIEKIKVEIDLPEYINAEKVVMDPLDRPFSYPEGSKITFSLTTDQPVLNARLTINGKKKEWPLRVMAGSEGSIRSSFLWSPSIKSASDLELEVQNEREVWSDPFRVEVTPMIDRKPSVSILSPSIDVIQHDIKEELEVQLNAEDDYGWSRVDWVIDDGGKETRRPILTGEPLKNAPTKLIRSFVPDFSSLSETTNAVTLSVEATDNRPASLGGGQKTVSRPLRIQFHAEASSVGEQAVESEAEWFLKRLESAIQEVEQAKKVAEDLINKPQEKDSEKAGKEPGLGKQIETARKSVSQLAKEIPAKAPMFQKRKETLEKLKDGRLSQAQQKSSQIPLHDESKEKKRIAGEVKDDLQKSLEELKEIQRESKEQVEAMKRAAKIDDLARRQKKLADQAKAANRDQKRNNDWKKKQEQVAKDLKELATKKEKNANDQLEETTRLAEKLSREARKLAERKRKAIELEKKAKKEASRDSAERKLDQVGSKKGRQTKPDGKDRPRTGKEDQLTKKSPDKKGQADKQKGGAKNKQPTDKKKVNSKGLSERKKIEGIKKAIEQDRKKLEKEAEKLAKRDLPNKEARDAAKNGLEQLKKEGSNSKSDSKQQGKAAETSPKSSNPSGANKKNRLQQKGKSEPLEKAAEHFQQVAEGCKECQNPGRKSGGGKKRGGGKSGRKTTGGKREQGKSGGQDDQKKLAGQRLSRATKEAEKASKSPDSEVAKNSSEEAAMQLDKLADQEAKSSGYCRQCNGKGKGKKTAKKGSHPSKGFNAIGASVRPGDTTKPNAVVRSGETSNWTKARKKVKYGVLDHRQDSVPDQYKKMVNRYFEELGKLGGDN